MNGSPIRYGVLTLLLSAGLSAQTILPFDWAGQSGLMIHQGAVLWNRDWTSGPLFFDGTFTSYPIRYGRSTAGRFQLSTVENVPQFKALPDSTAITSYFDYYRGDHIYDQLEIGTRFDEKDRVISLDAFKRSYGGDLGHYLYSGRGLVPIQQSYRLGYNTRWNNNRLEAGAGRFITRSGLPDSTFNGSIDDDIFTAGINGKTTIGVLSMDYRGAQFQQQRKVLHSTRKDSTNTFLNRTHISGRISHEGGFALGINADVQTITMDTVFRKMSWTTLYGEKRFGNLRLLAGYSILSGEENKPFYRFLYDRRNTQSWLTADVSFEHRPQHPVFQDPQDEQQYDSWYRGNLHYGRKGERFRWEGSLGAGTNENEDLGANAAYLSVSLEGEYEFIPGWSIHVEFLGQPDSSVYLPHIGKILTTGIWGNLNLFRKNLALKAHLWGTGWLDRSANFSFDPLHEVPFSQSNGQTLPDQWSLHFEVFATVSTVVLTYRMMNLLNVASPLLGGLKQDLIRVRPGDFYPSLGRLISFGVTWNFKD